MPRKNVESFAGSAQYGDRNKGLVDWKVVFAGERERYAVQSALKGTPTQRKRPHADEIDIEELVCILRLTRARLIFCGQTAAAAEYAAQAAERKKNKKNKKDAAAAAAAEETTAEA